MSETRCERCGGPCKVRPLLDSSRFANDIFGFSAHVARCHAWFEPERLAEVARIVAETRALPVIPTFPCVVCKKFAFERDGVTCYWCGRGVPEGVTVAEVVLLPREPGEPTVIVAPPARRPAKRSPILDPPPSLF